MAEIGRMDPLNAFGWVALIVIPVVLAVWVTLAVLLGRDDQED